MSDIVPTTLFSLQGAEPRAYGKLLKKLKKNVNCSQ